jgi:hypothetical protein
MATFAGSVLVLVERREADEARVGTAMRIDS